MPISFTARTVSLSPPWQRLCSASQPWTQSLSSSVNTTGRSAWRARRAKGGLRDGTAHQVPQPHSSPDTWSTEFHKVEKQKPGRAGDTVTQIFPACKLTYPHRRSKLILCARLGTYPPLSGPGYAAKLCSQELGSVSREAWTSEGQHTFLSQAQRAAPQTAFAALHPLWFCAVPASWLTCPTSFQS